MNTKNMPSDNTVDNEPLKSAASCLQRFLQTHGGTGRPYEVLDYLASTTLECLEQDKEPKFKNMALQDAIMGNMSKDPSAWMSPIWKKLTLNILPSIEDALEAFARNKGYEYYPWVGKTESSGGAGNQTFYYLTARKVSSSKQNFQHSLDKAEIYYLPAMQIVPSWWARFFFGKDYSAYGWRRTFYIWLPLVSIFSVGTLGTILWISLSRLKTPLSASDLVLFLFLGGGLFYCCHVINRFVRLAEDRIMMAPDSLVGYREFGVCIELFKEDIKDKSKLRTLRLVKYVAECPLCGAEVLLDKGEPDFPRRIVGRCLESPQEHVFSFDRVTKTGINLRKIHNQNSALVSNYA